MQIVGDSRKLVNTIRIASEEAFFDKGEFLPYFQPIVLLRSGQLAGFEVLARWKHPDFGLLAPDHFIPLAEQHGWIDRLTRQLLPKAFAAASCLPDPLTLSINISSVQLRSPGLPRLIREAAEGTGFSLERLIVEITESALIDNLDCAQEISKELKAMGCAISLDDFGTGYSSLLHLQSLPFDELKVDRGFVSSMSERRQSRKIVGAVISLGQSLGLRTVAEGIETEEQAEMMLCLGCEFGQGWFYGRPVPAQELASNVAATRHKLTFARLNPSTQHAAANLNMQPALRLAQLQAVYDGAPIGLALLDKNLRYLNLNHRLAQMNGAPLEHHLGSKVADMAPELFPQLESFMRRALAGEAFTDLEASVPSSGETRLVSYHPARDEAGEIVGISVAVLDMTPRIRAEDALRKSKAQSRARITGPKGLYPSLTLDA